MKELTVHAPGTVANVACGFDILGFALQSPGDQITVRLNDSHHVSIGEMQCSEPLPRDVEENVASVAIQAMLDHLSSKQGVVIDIEKGITPGSGIGSSAASSAGAVVALNELMGSPCTPEELVTFAMEGERVASGSAHADNVAPAIMGGFILVRDYNPLDIIRLETDLQLHAVVLHPNIEIKTSDARGLLRQQISLKKAVQQWGNVAGFVAGLLKNDLALLSRSMIDVIIEPIRSILIPNYNDVREAATEAGALGCSISGSGPSVFALCENSEVAQNVAERVKKVYSQLDIEFDIYQSAVNNNGCNIISEINR
mgnify:FL=1